MGLGDDATAALQLADDAFSRGDTDEGIAHLSAAVRGFTAAGDDRAAAMTCARIGDVFQNRLGDEVAARPGFVRARALTTAGIEIYRFANGRIVECWGQYDMTELFTPNP